MPTYAFRCKRCGKRFNLEMTISQYESGRVKCKKCKSTRVDRVYEPFVAQTSKKS